MGLLKTFQPDPDPAPLPAPPSGSFTVHREGTIGASTLPSTISPILLADLAQTISTAFLSADQAGFPLTDLHLKFRGLTITAIATRSGFIVFFQPTPPESFTKKILPFMPTKNLQEFILQFESYIDSWKQFNHLANLARTRKFTDDDESQFLEVKSLIAQGLEAIAAAKEKSGPNQTEVLALFALAPSLRFLADSPDALSRVESQWHLIYLQLQSLLGQLKVEQNRPEKSSPWNLFGRK